MRMLWAQFPGLQRGKDEGEKKEGRKKNRSIGGRKGEILIGILTIKTILMGTKTI